jgi:hypothetical protein
LVAQGDVLLSITLCDLNCVVDVRKRHGVVCNVRHSTRAAAALEVAGESRRSARPDFDARAVRSVGHTDVVDVDVATVAPEVLHNDVGAIRLEGDAIVAVVDVRVLDNNVVRAVGVPATTSY